MLSIRIPRLRIMMALRANRDLRGNSVLDFLLPRLSGRAGGCQPGAVWLYSGVDCPRLALTSGANPLRDRRVFHAPYATTALPVRFLALFHAGIPGDVPDPIALAPRAVRGVLPRAANAG